MPIPTAGLPPTSWLSLRLGRAVALTYAAALLLPGTGLWLRREHSLLPEHIANRDHMDTAAHRDSRWLFPGRRVGRPYRPGHLSGLLNKAGVPGAAARSAAIRQQPLELPAPVVADALGYHDKTTCVGGGLWHGLLVVEQCLAGGLLELRAAVDDEGARVERLPRGRLDHGAGVARGAADRHGDKVTGSVVGGVTFRVRAPRAMLLSSWASSAGAPSERANSRCCSSVPPRSSRADSA
ncbi:hypothetical protein [Streptomyces naphthomycinicus]|uniref:hypothetical protein n=1 Tax=Streptomyces naphthomycinicus TaxID=2872625 RepID=UPI0028894932|nr:hypothetical protein [Streptomyces sp. TML10]